ncbi:MAG: hypothetical protein R2932_25185 [Caldilineaceae bacterium]
MNSNNNAAGVVAANPAGPYLAGEIVTLTVTVNPGWTFSGWSGDHAGQTAPVTIIMDRNKAVTATFAEALYTLTVNPVTGQDAAGGFANDFPVWSLPLR